jgi:DHA1 family bicyclomycin/chloramphenicol resistance-like MFS transporter
VDAIAMVRDVSPVEQSSRIISMLILILGVSSLLGPTVGGVVATTLGWHWKFLILAIIVHRQFRTYALAGAFSFYSLLVYVAGLPLIFMDMFHVSAPKYGAIFAPLSVGFIGSNQLNI